MNVLTIIVTVIGIALLMGLFFKIHDFIKNTYLKVAHLSHLLTRDVTWYFEAFLDSLARLRKKIFKNSREDTLPAFGGIGRLIFMIILLVLSVVMGVVVFSNINNVDDLFFEFGLKAPPMFLLSIIVNIGDFSVFSFTDMVQTAIIGAVPIAFFHLDGKRAISDAVRYIYSAIFAVFFLLAAYFIPSEIFMFPAGVLLVFTDIFEFLGNLISASPLGIVGVLFAIIVILIYLAVLFISLYALFCLLIVTVKEFIASVVVSLIPTVALFLFVIILQKIFPALSSNAAGDYILIGFILVLMVVSNIIRNKMEDDADSDAESADLARETKLERRAANRAVRRSVRAAKSGKPELPPEAHTGYAPFPTRVFRSVKYILTAVYRRNA